MYLQRVRVNKSQSESKCFGYEIKNCLDLYHFYSTFQLKDDTKKIYFSLSGREKSVSGSTVVVSSAITLVQIKMLAVRSRK